eukprot:Hpha_TRINITY_DN20056_c0_g1::TRINITY_DN20056_c0_g1_i1::g.147756::m.147756
MPWQEFDLGAEQSSGPFSLSALPNGAVLVAGLEASSVHVVEYNTEGPPVLTVLRLHHSPVAVRVLPDLSVVSCCSAAVHWHRLGGFAEGRVYLKAVGLVEEGSERPAGFDAKGDGRLAGGQGEVVVSLCTKEGVRVRACNDGRVCNITRPGPPATCTRWSEGETQWLAVRWGLSELNLYRVDDSLSLLETRRVLSDWGRLAEVLPAAGGWGVLQQLDAAPPEGEGGPQPACGLQLPMTVGGGTLPLLEGMTRERVPLNQVAGGIPTEVPTGLLKRVAAPRELSLACVQFADPEAARITEHRTPVLGSVPAGSRAVCGSFADGVVLVAHDTESGVAVLRATVSRSQAPAEEVSPLRVEPGAAKVSVLAVSRLSTGAPVLLVGEEVDSETRQATFFFAGRKPLRRVRLLVLAEGGGGGEAKGQDEERCEVGVDAIVRGVGALLDAKLGPFMAKVESRLESMEQRLGRLESRLGHAPVPATHEEDGDVTEVKYPSGTQVLT